MERGIGGSIKNNFDQQLNELVNIMTMSYTLAQVGSIGRKSIIL